MQSIVRQKTIGRQKNSVQPVGLFIKRWEEHKKWLMTKETREMEEWRRERIYEDGDVHRNPGPNHEHSTKEQNRKDAEVVWNWLKGSATKIAERLTKSGINTSFHFKWKDFEGDRRRRGAVSIASQNANGGVFAHKDDNQCKERDELMSYKQKMLGLIMKECNIQIALVQECGRTNKVEITQAVGKIMGYSCLVNVNEQELNKGKKGKKQKSSKGEGMMIQMSQSMKARTPEHYRDIKGRLQCALITGKKRQGQQQAVLAVANVYMPAQNNGNLEKYKDEVEEMTGMIGEWVGDATKKGYNVLVMGDLNVALSERDRSSGKLSRLDKWTGPKVEAWGLTDIWRYKHPKKAGHTWQGSYEERKISSRIDYACIM